MKTQLTAITLILMILTGGNSLADEIHEMAKRKNLERITQILEKNGSLVNKPDSLGKTPLFYAINDLETTKYLLKVGADINIKDKYGNQAIHEASNRLGKPECLEILIENGADVNGKGNNGKTPLHVAVYNGSAPKVIILLAYNADPNIKDNYGNTPLAYATSFRKDIIEALKEKGAK